MGSCATVTGNHRLCIAGLKSRVQFSVDTGVNFSVLPMSQFECENQVSDYKFYTANSTEIKTFGAGYLSGPSSFVTLNRHYLAQILLHIISNLWICIIRNILIMSKANAGKGPS